MVKRMLIDATHLEETRVVIANGTRLDEFDFESSTKRQLKGNIYLAKVTRVEPSLQAAFVDFGGNRHGFLPFSEIHPDYYQIPVADRIALLAEQKRMGGYGDSDADFEPVSERGMSSDVPHAILADPPAELFDEPADESSTTTAAGEEPEPAPENTAWADADAQAEAAPAEVAPTPEATPSLAQQTASDDGMAPPPTEITTSEAPTPSDSVMPLLNPTVDQDVMSSPVVAGESVENGEPSEAAPIVITDAEPTPSVEGNHVEVREAPQHLEMVGGADEVEAEVEGAAAERRRGRVGRHRYKIQEVIKRRQILLIQVVKEERGNKGAALTTYLSLAGRYCVLMPNTARGGGISRKISSPADRKRLKAYLDELDIPEGMAVILRTAAVERNKTELKRDYEYLLRQWDEVRELTLKSIAPAGVYEEANLIKRSIRDHYTKDVDEVLVEGDEGYRTAKEFMRMLMPSHAKKVQQYRDPEIPLFHRYQIEGQLDAMHNPVVTLKSGGYIVINPTEALVAIDVNSGRATRERNIEETAYKTNCEAADEIARQLRLRDLAGLIVIDFIDMEENRNQHNVEKRLKEAMRVDRARIQIGKISPFGLLELSRQRLRPSFLEASTERCPHCEGTGLVRSTESAALHVIRAVEEEGIRRRAAEIRLVVPTDVALYILNHKRAALVAAEARYSFDIIIDTDNALIPPNFRLERLKAQTAPPPSPTIQAAPLPDEDAIIDDELAAAAEEADEAIVEDEVEISEAREDGEPRAAEQRGERRDDRGERNGERRPRRRRRRGGDERDRNGNGNRDQGRNRQERPDQPAIQADSPVAASDTDSGTIPAGDTVSGDVQHAAENPGAEGRPGDGDRKRRRRGKRGGRRRRRHEDGSPDARSGATDNGETIHAEHSETTTAQPDWQTPDDGAPVSPPHVQQEFRQQEFRQQESRPSYDERPATAERYGNGANADERNGAPPAREPAHREPVHVAPEPSPAPPPASPQSDAPKRKGWWQRLTE